MRRVLVLTGTRADFGKQKRLMRALEADPAFELRVVVTGMHLLQAYGETVQEVEAESFADVHRMPNQIPGEPADLVLANTMVALGRLVHEDPPDAIVVHGDRIEALAGATVGALRNIRVVHLEGGELSGTIDGSLRHAITKLAHVHLVANDDARGRLVRLGEDPERIAVIGSPEVDALLAPDLPAMTEVRRWYEIPDGPVGIAILHPVTTDPVGSRRTADALVDALIRADLPFVIIDPNNDEGTAAIRHAYERLDGSPRFRRLPSMRFEWFVTLLREASVIVGNSSSGVREAPVFGTPSVDIGSRQRGRADAPTIRHVGPDADAIAAAIGASIAAGRGTPTRAFGSGGSVERAIAVLRDERTWDLPLDKTFFEEDRP